jgi:enterochelin esterase-like enzyme
MINNNLFLTMTIFVCLFVAVCFTALAQQHGTTEVHGYKSSVLGKDVNYAVYLPPGYSPDTRKYPILFLLHGYSGNHLSWLNEGAMGKITDELLDKNEITPLIIVTADVGNSWYINAADGSGRYEDMYINEFIPLMESRYGAIGGKNGRFIGGLSMGGYGSLLYAIKYPEMFSVCIAMSPAVFTDEEFVERIKGKGTNFNMNSLYGVKNATMSELWKQNSIINSVKTIPDKNKNTVYFYIDCGDDDFLYKGNSTLHIVMRDRKIPHEYRVRDGGHEWAYWRQCLHDGLIYINKCIKR